MGLVTGPSGCGPLAAAVEEAECRELIARSGRAGAGPSGKAGTW